MPASPRSRVLRRLSIAFGFGLLLAFVPVPGMRFVTESVGASTPVPTARAVTPGQRAVLQAAADAPLGPDRVMSADPAVDTFTTIGFTFDKAPTQPVLVRVRDATGSFGPWRELNTEIDEGPDAGSADLHGGRPTAGTEPFWVGHGTGYEVNLGSADAKAADVVTVHDVERRTTVEATPMAGATATPPFGIASRESWGARAPTSTSYGSTVKLAVVHHSASSNSYNPADVPGILRSIQAYHMDGRGWSDIAYNFVVDKFGGIWEGRGGGIDRPVIGAHAMGFNTNSVGVMVIGDYTLTGPTPASLESVSQVIGWKLALHGANPSGQVSFLSGGSLTIPAGVTVTLPRVVGHQDVGATDCPGSIEGALPSIRSRAQQWTNADAPLIVGRPIGFLETAALDSAFGPRVIRVKGWAYDPDTEGQIQVNVVFNGRTLVPLLANNSRPDVAAANGGAGAFSGFDRAIPLTPGVHEVCVEAVGVGPGGDLFLGCRQVVVK